MMNQDINTRFMNMPERIRAYTIANPDLSYTVVLNARLSAEQQQKSYWHELKHIKNGDFDRKLNSDLIEIYTHGGGI